VRAFAFDSKIVTLNEPTTSMLEYNAEQVLNRVYEVAYDCRIGIIYVSHKTPEAMSVSDSVAVLRDSLVAFRFAIGDTAEGEIVRVDRGSTGTVGINGKRRAIHNPRDTVVRRGSRLSPRSVNARGSCSKFRPTLISP